MQFGSELYWLGARHHGGYAILAQFVLNADQGRSASIDLVTSFPNLAILGNWKKVCLTHGSPQHTFRKS